jgi:hypothetical protein
MQEQNFEKQVDKIMDDLVIQPSPSVWQKVEEQIRRKKDRRRIVFWLLPVLLVSIGLSYWFISSDSNGMQKQIDIPSANLKENINSIVKTPSPDQQEILPASPGNTIKRNQELQTSNKKYFSDKNNINTQVHTKQNFQNTTINEIFKPIPDSLNTQVIDPTIEVQKDIILNIPNEQLPVKKSDSTVSEVEEKAQLEVANSIVDSSEVVQIELDTSNEVPTGDKTILSDASSKWKIVPYVAAGFSNVSKGLFDPVASADYSATPGNTTGGSFFPPSVPEKGLYFSGGIRMIKKLNNRFEISTGIQYSYISTKQYIGTRVVNDTIISYSNMQLRVQDYYQNGNTKKYTNNYHFISLPVAIEYQLLNNFPLSIQAGVSVNRLVSTNALLYNSNSNIQFENDKVWNKTQLHSFSGLQFHFFKNKSFSFKTGPFVQYSFTRLEQNRKQFLSVAGLQSQFYFQNKK